MATNSPFLPAPIAEAAQIELVEAQESAHADFYDSPAALELTTRLAARWVRTGAQAGVLITAITAVTHAINEIGGHTPAEAGQTDADWRVGICRDAATDLEEFGAQAAHAADQDGVCPATVGLLRMQAAWDARNR